MNSYAKQASDPETLTTNGEETFSTSKPVNVTTQFPAELVDFYYQLTRHTPTGNVEDYFGAAFKRNPLYATRLAFQLRDCRQNNPGKGERELFHKCMIWLIKNGHANLVHKFIMEGQLEKFGSWHDVVKMMCEYTDKKTQCVAAEYLFTTLKRDMEYLSIPEKKSQISLAAKWAPSERSKMWNKNPMMCKDFVTMFYKFFDFPAGSTQTLLKCYRNHLTALRAHLNVVESLMCARKWDDIALERVPSIAMKNYRNAFKKHCAEKLDAFLKKVANGQAHINSGQLFPSDVVKQYFTRVGAKNDVLEAQWTELTKKYASSLGNSLALVDVSGSMSGVPLENAVALGLLISNAASPAFKDRFITFSSKPQLYDLSACTSLFDKVQTMNKSPWTLNTDFWAVHKLIVEHAVREKIPQSDFPERLFVFSDMQFDAADSSYTGVTHDKVKRLYADNGYTLPTVVYWNLNGEYQTTPVKSNYDNTVLISGYSANVLQYLIETGEVPTPEKFVKDLVEHSAYQCINIDV
jgi:hypothetical protein